MGVRVGSEGYRVWSGGGVKGIWRGKWGRAKGWSEDKMRTQ